MGFAGVGAPDRSGRLDETRGRAAAPAGPRRSSPRVFGVSTDAGWTELASPRGVKVCIEMYIPPLLVLHCSKRSHARQDVM